MKGKYYLLNVLFLTIFFFSCEDKNQKKINREIDIGICLGAPKFFTAHYPIVTACKNGGIIGGISDSNVGDNEGWTSCDSFQTIESDGDYPDSLHLEWTDKLNCKRFEKGVKLPSSIINSIINKELKKNLSYYNFGFKVNFAPGGNFCVFLNDIEIKRGVANFTEIDSNCVAQDGISKISTEYYNKVGLDFKNWEKSDPRYDLGLGYYTVDTNMVFGWAHLISKEGILTRNDNLYKSKEDEIYGGKIITYGNSYLTIQDLDSKSNKFQLPVLIQTYWYKEIGKSQIYKYTNVPLPKNFVKLYTTPYINPKNNKLTNYNHLIFGVEKDGVHCIIWLDGPGKREKLMRFEATDAIMSKDNNVYPGGYAKNIIYY
ncbi:DUF2931 family protein [Flavobacterium terrigena]|uniref:Uncharacterized protein n=1 Tax=Flavobacterium terrigena TaxID=402734 RepID=A0A1H6SIG4_9FLAO|nr:DUF2931 family protein [Flavobacterium terrigena]SEI63810.1 Protein of unknown function [Flavobacterium terrigena]